jgi:arsenite methyltransferase
VSQPIIQTTKADYGLDAPGLVRNFLVWGIVLALAGLGAGTWANNTLGNSFFLPIIFILGIGLLAAGIGFLFSSILMFWSSRFGKMRARDRLLDDLQLRGDETVLDVGCGRGLLLLGAAQRLPHGKALGLDLWSQEDQSGNCKRMTLANACAESVTRRVEVHDGDMRKMPFADASVDVAMASLSIHNIYNREGRRRAINEIVRVLKPGGKVALMDIQHVQEYADDLIAAGICDVQVSGLSFWIYPPVRTVTGVK